MMLTSNATPGIWCCRSSAHAGNCGCRRQRLRSSGWAASAVRRRRRWPSAGSARVGLIDPDTVSLSNLPRRQLFRAADVGRPKALVAAEVLEEAGPGLSVTVALDPVRTGTAERLLAEDTIWSSTGQTTSIPAWLSLTGVPKKRGTPRLAVLA